MTRLTAWVFDDAEEYGLFRGAFGDCVFTARKIGPCKRRSLEKVRSDCFSVMGRKERARGKSLRFKNGEHSAAREFVRIRTRLLHVYKLSPCKRRSLGKESASFIIVMQCGLVSDV